VPEGWKGGPFPGHKWGFVTREKLKVAVLALASTFPTRPKKEDVGITKEVSTPAGRQSKGDRTSFTGHVVKRGGEKQ